MQRLAAGCLLIPAPPDPPPTVYCPLPDLPGLPLEVEEEPLRWLLVVWSLSPSHSGDVALVHPVLSWLPPSFAPPLPLLVPVPQLCPAIQPSQTQADVRSRWLAKHSVLPRHP
jgi:hypothetical protein